MAGDVIKEFLVSLGYRVEANQEKKFTAAVGSATNAVVAMGAAAAAASAAVSAAVIKISRSFDGLYWQAQRTQTTVSQIKAISYAVSQLGGSADEAGSSIESFGKNLKWNPGFEGFLKQIGVVTRSNGQLRDSVALMKDFATVLKGKSRAEQMGLAAFAGIDLKTLEALQSGDLAKRMAEHSATLKKLGVDEDEAARKANALQIALAKLNDTLSGIGALLLDRFGPSLTKFFESVNDFVVQNADKIVDFFEKLGKVTSELYTVFEKLLEVVGPLWQKFDNLTQSIAGVDGLTAALVALIGLKVATWLLGVAAAITQVGTAASVALLGGALGKFLRLFGIGGAIALGMSPTEANGGEDQEIARRRAAGTFGPAGAGQLEADAAKRAQGRGQDNSLWGRAKRWWNGSGSAAAATTDSASPEERRQRMIRRSRGGGASNSWLSKEQSSELALGIRKTGADLGVAPDDLATAISYETGGTMHPWKRGPTTKWGQHRGLIQWGKPQREKYGVTEETSITDQMSAVTRYLKDTGVKPGHGLGHIYSAINAGNASEKYWNRSDAHAGGAPGTVADKVRGMRGPHGGALSNLEKAGGLAPPAVTSSTERGQTEGPAAKKSGFKVDNNLGASDKGSVAKESLFYNSQGVANQNLDPRLTKTEKGGASLFDPSSVLIKAADNAAKTEGGGLGGNGSALTPPPASTAGTSITINQENHTSVTGSGDPHDTAQRIGQTQKDTNAGMVRDLKGAVR